jgi:hypothetical protein
MEKPAVEATVTLLQEGKQGLQVGMEVTAV